LGVPDDAAIGDNMPRSFAVLTCALLILISTSVGQQASPAKKERSQPQPTPQDDITKHSFEALIRERDSLSDEIGTISTDLMYVNDAITKRGELKTAKQEKRPQKAIKAIADGLNSDMGFAHLAPAATPDSLEAELSDKKQLQQVKQERKNGIDAELERRANVVGPQQTFKLEMSIIFAVLVAAVIAGFFTIAFQDERVRHQIFAGQAGIQFVTLFSLVIAIILFGIIEILEGRELAALLGGLSGYILGRSTTRMATRAAPRAA
jgi:hypothetical protein